MLQRSRRPPKRNACRDGRSGSESATRRTDERTLVTTHRSTASGDAASDDASNDVARNETARDETARNAAPNGDEATAPDRELRDDERMYTGEPVDTDSGPRRPLQIHIGDENMEGG